jgi:hypothetical protein
MRKQRSLFLSPANDVICFCTFVFTLIVTAKGCSRVVFCILPQLLLHGGFLPIAGLTQKRNVIHRIACQSFFFRHLAPFFCPLPPPSFLILESQYVCVSCACLSLSDPIRYSRYEKCEFMPFVSFVVPSFFCLFNPLPKQVIWHSLPINGCFSWIDLKNALPKAASLSSCATY